ncbi:MAG TPA: DUF1501 domain-containing protein [Pirellulales bacterium]|nr:DUF1501 domain-containing protein [Pirellulales bacterium]
MITRRQILRWGTLGSLSLTLSDLVNSKARAASTTRPAKSCVLFFLEGGPAHQDLWDMKPGAPAEVRGEFEPIATSAPGIRICEHLPLLARQMHHVMLVQSVHHGVVDHNAGSYYALTGRLPVKGGQLIVRDEVDNFPPFGSVMSHLRPADRRLPAFVHVPEIMSNNGYDLPGQRAGFLGAAYDPLVTGDASVPGYEVPGLGLPAEIPIERLDRRHRLLRSLDERLAQLADDPSLDRFASHQREAFQLLTSTDARRAFDLAEEPDSVRSRYGLPDRTDRSREARQFGGLPHLGQCMLLARRLVEAGVRLVTVGTGRRFDQSWDTHRQHFPLLKRSLLPYFDRAFSALLEDLDSRGLLQETLVVAMGEFGRTPKLGQITSGAGADAAGRDHWPHCYTVLFAGAGVRGGSTFGQSDRWAAFPARDPVTPEDIAATIYRAMGIDPETRIADPLARPQSIALGRPISGIFGP